MTSPLILAILCVALFWVLRRYGHGPRVRAWLIGGAAFFGVFASTALLGALLARTGSGDGLGVLVIVLIVSGLMFLFEALLAHKYHPVGTPFVSVIFGASAAVAVADWHAVRHEGTHLLPKTASAIGKEIHHARNGHLLQHGQSAHQAAVLLAVAAIGVLFAFAVMHRRHARHGTPGPAPRPVMQKAPKALNWRGVLGVKGGQGFGNVPRGARDGSQPALESTGRRR
jgi:hypothetical protein